jgi:hypothetical protein
MPSLNAFLRKLGGRGISAPMPDTSKKPDAGRKLKLTDAERHQRFIDMAHEVGASEDPKDFDKAFKRVTGPKILAAKAKTDRK